MLFFLQQFYIKILPMKFGTNIQFLQVSFHGFSTATNAVTAKFLTLSTEFSTLKVENSRLIIYKISLHKYIFED